MCARVYHLYLIFTSVCVYARACFVCIVCALVYICIYIIVHRACVLVCVSHWLCVSACAHECMCVSACGGDTPFLLKLISVLSKTELPLYLVIAVHPTQTPLRFNSYGYRFTLSCCISCSSYILNNGLPTMALLVWTLTVNRKICIHVFSWTYILRAFIWDC